MNILALDTTGQKVLILIRTSGRIYFKEYNNRAGSSRVILTLINDLLKESELTISQIDQLGYINGPGSFTGLRLSASIIQALSYSKNIPIIGISRLQAIAQSFYDIHQNQNIIVLLEALREELYYAKITVDPSNSIIVKTQDEIVIKASELSNYIPNDDTYNIIGDVWDNISLLNKNKNLTFWQDYKPIVEKKAFIKLIMHESINSVRAQDLRINYVKQPHLIVNLSKND